MSTKIRKILKQFKKELAEIYGERLESIILFGSRAFVSEKDYTERQTPFLMNVRREGIMV